MGQNFDVNTNLLSLRSFATSFEQISLKPDFIHVYSPGTRNNPLGTIFLYQQENLVTLVICCKFNKISLKSDFLQAFFLILYMYIAPGQGQITPGDKIVMSTETSCHFGHLLQVSEKIL